MHEEIEDKETQVSRPAVGAPGANSASAPREVTPFDQNLQRARSAVPSSPPMTPSYSSYDPQAEKQTELGGDYRAGGSLGGDTVVIRPEPDVNTVGLLFCRKGLRRGQLFLLRKQRSEFGRAPDCDVMIEDAAVSSHHGAFLLEEKQWQIFDFASVNGTFVGGERIGKTAPNPRPLVDGDVISLGESEWVFKQID